MEMDGLDGRVASVVCLHLKPLGLTDWKHRNPSKKIGRFDMDIGRPEQQSNVSPSIVYTIQGGVFPPVTCDASRTVSTSVIGPWVAPATDGAEIRKY